MKNARTALLVVMAQIGALGILGSGCGSSCSRSLRSDYVLVRKIATDTDLLLSGRFRFQSARESLSSEFEEPAHFPCLFASRLYNLPTNVDDRNIVEAVSGLWHARGYRIDNSVTGPDAIDVAGKQYSKDKFERVLRFHFIGRTSLELIVRACGCPGESIPSVTNS